MDEHGSASDTKIANVERWMLVLGRLFAAAALGYLIASLVPPWQGFVRHLPFVSNSVVKCAVLSQCCFLAAGDLRRHAGMLRIVLLGHAISVVAMLGFLGGLDTSATTALGVSLRTVLAAAIALDGAILVLLVAAWLRTRGVDAPPVAERGDSGPAERHLRTFLIVAAAAFALAVVLYEAGPFVSGFRELSRELPFVSNSVVKVAILALLCWHAAGDVRARQAAVDVVFVGHLVSAAAMAVMLAFADTSVLVPIAGTAVRIRDVMLGALALDLGIAVAVAWFAIAAWRERSACRFFRPVEYRVLLALARAIVAGPDGALKVSPEQMVARVDLGLVDLRARRRLLFRAALFALQLLPLLRCRGPLAEQSVSRVRELLKTSFGYARPWRARGMFRQLIPAAIRIAKQLVYVGYYGDPASHPSIGYKTFEQRVRDAGRDVPPPVDPPLRVDAGNELPDRVRVDVCVIGSGAAGAVIAHDLAKSGRSVLVVERGRFVKPSEFSADEAQMIARLYDDGIFQQSRDYRFTVLQGSCVGGTTVVNNAVCFAPPPAVLARWNAPENDARIDVAELEKDVASISKWVRVEDQMKTTPPAVLNPSGAAFRDAVQRAGQQFPGGAPVVHANIDGCLGCGYCNIGCRYGKKLSMLDLVLPEAQATGKVRIASDLRVERLRTLSGRPHRVLDAQARDHEGRTITIEAETFVVAAGAISSSWLLKQSAIGGREVGRRLSFNMGSFLTAELEQKVDSYAGLQISHWAKPAGDAGFVLETWFNPPIAQAINMPGWFEDHFANMLRYDHMMAVGALVGTESSARLKPALTGGADIVFEPSKADMRKLAAGLRATASLLFDAGAKRVMANTWRNEVFHRADDPALERFLAQIVDEPGYVALGTGHPQGGTALGPERATTNGKHAGVVGPDFRVHGYGNLFVCDASVFPTSLTVNPQLTIMSLARYAARRIR